MKILAIDPGTTQSAVILYDDAKHEIEIAEIIPNELVLEEVSRRSGYSDTLVIEMFKSYGMSVGDSVLQTCVWIGRFLERWQGPSDLIFRKTVVSEICGTATANDKNIRNALICYFNALDPKKALDPRSDHNSPQKQKPAILGPITKDLWSALAIAVAWSDMRKRKQKYALTF